MAKGTLLRLLPHVHDFSHFHMRRIRIRVTGGYRLVLLVAQHSTPCRFLSEVLETSDTLGRADRGGEEPLHFFEELSRRQSTLASKLRLSAVLTVAFEGGVRVAEVEVQVRL